jgi:hypothetical protein
MDQTRGSEGAGNTLSHPCDIARLVYAALRLGLLRTSGWPVLRFEPPLLEWGTSHVLHRGTSPDLRPLALPPANFEPCSWPCPSSGLWS